MDEASHIGLDHRAFWYGGVLHINRLGPYCTRMDFAAGAAGLDRGKRDFDTLCAKVGAADGLASIYYHPCEWVADAFWDAANFARGANPPRSEWQLPSLRSSTQMAAGLQLFSEYLAYVKSRPNVEILTGRQIINLLPDRVRQRRFSRAEIADLAHFADGEIGFVEKNGIALAPSELFSLVIDALCNMGANANIFAAASTPYGPTRRKNSSLSPNAKLPTSTFLGICQDLQNQLHKTHQLPDQIWIGADTLAPADFYQTATHLLRSTIVSSNLPDITPIQLGHLALEHHVRDDAWSWPIFRENFSAPNLVELGRLQTWTLKPALLSTHEGAFTPS
jgi:hypothetical protein